MTKISDQIAILAGYAGPFIPDQLYELKPLESSGIIPYIVRPGRDIPFERQWLDLRILVSRINLAAGRLPFTYNAFRLLLEFAISLESERWMRFIYNVRFSSRSSWADDLEVKEARISESFGVLVELGVMRPWKRDTDKKYYVFTEAFCEFLTGKTDELPQSARRQEAQKLQAKRQNSAPKRVDNQSSDVRPAVPEKYEQPYIRDTASRTSEIRPAVLRTYIEISYPINSVFKNSLSNYRRIQVPQPGDNSRANVTDLPAAAMARRLLAHHHLRESFDKTTKWIAAYINVYGLEPMDAFLIEILRKPPRETNLHKLGDAMRKFSNTMQKPLYGGAI